MRISLELPDRVAQQWGENVDQVARTVAEDAAIEAYRGGRLSHRQVGAFLGLDYWETEQFLKARGVPLNYSPTDLEMDADTFAAIQEPR